MHFNRKSTSNIASHRKSIATFNIKEKSTTCDEVEGDDVEFPVRPKSRSVAYQSGSSPRPPMHRASTSKLRVRFDYPTEVWKRNLQLNKDQAF